jgi:hypothetical protein
LVPGFFAISVTLRETVYEKEKPRASAGFLQRRGC